MPLSRRSPLAAATAAWLAAAAPTQGDLDADVRQALDAARPALMAHLREVAEQPSRPGELALLTLAAIHDGIAADDEVLGRAIARLAKAQVDQTYDLALRLCVLEAWPAFPDRAKIAAADTKELLTHRDRSGGFGYTRASGEWDLSNTQYAALGLRAGAALGATVDRRVWARLADEIGAQQDPYGGFGYRRRNSGFASYASMTAAGIAVLAICRQHLPQPTEELDRRIGRGWQWFARNVDTIGSPDERWSFYFHYGLERAAILTDQIDVGGADWYRRGAQMLVRLQMPGGGWTSAADGHLGTHADRGRGHGVPTAFAVLFLRRKFQKETAAVTAHVVRLVNLGPHSKDADVNVCAEQLVQRGKAALPEVLQALRSDVAPQRRAAARALQELAGGTFGYDAGKDAAANRDAVKAAELWYLKHR
ncbi:MAG: hypothetical protein JNL08_06975 [Planctomycetes bacterium]|nr:hypothetical protein [Planctomycetota bacterium]